MSRPLRIEYPGAWYHVMNRGARYQDVFLNDTHRELFLELLCELFEDYGVEIHAYCLMDNHYHLLCHTPQGNLGRGMRHLNGVYTQRFNRLENLDGSLFRGRYKAIVVDADSYLQQVSRYIHLNPLEADMVDDPVSYSWSSYPAYLHRTKKPEWLTTNAVLGYFDGCSERYQTYVEAGVDTETQRFYGKQRGSPIMGDKRFKDRLLETTEYDVMESPESRRVMTRMSISEIESRVCQAYAVQIDQLHKSIRGQKNEPRLVAMYLSRKIGGMTYPAIAAHYNLGHYKSAASAIIRVQEDERLLRKAEQFRRKWDHTI
jgi:putative transposase